MIKRTFSLVFATLMALTGCHEEGQLEIPVEELDTIQAGLEQGSSSSRMLINAEDNAMTWAKDDAFKVFTADGSKASIWVLKDEDAGKKTGTFTGTQLGIDLAGAFYPSDVVKGFSNQVVTVELPSEISYAGNNLDAPMWASFSSWDESISFKHLCALLKVNMKGIPGEYSQLKVESKPSIAGMFTYGTTQDLTSDFSGLVPVSHDAGAVTVDFEGYTLPEDQSLWFFLPMPVGEYEYIKIALVKNDGTAKVLSERYNREIVRAKVYRTSLTFKEIDVTTPSEVSKELNSSLSEDNKTVTLSMTETITATEENNTITIPTVENNSSTVALVFEKTPDTSEDIPLVISEEEKTETVSNDQLEISAPSETVFQNLVIDTPSKTVTLKEGYFEVITARTATNTLVVGNGTTIGNVVVEQGNVRIAANGKITGSIMNATSTPLYIYLEPGATVENNLPPASSIIGDFTIRILQEDSSGSGSDWSDGGIF